MKIRMTGKGYEKFTGMFGMVEFKDGVSVHDLTQRELDAMAAVVRVEAVNEADNDRLIGNRYMANKDNPAPKNVDRTHVEQPKSEEPAKQESVASLGKYSKESLEAIADEKGIAGLREVATPLGIRGNSIRGLIQEILNKQG